MSKTAVQGAEEMVQPERKTRARKAPTSAETDPAGLLQEEAEVAQLEAELTTRERALLRESEALAERSRDVTGRHESERRRAATVVEQAREMDLESAVAFPDIIPSPPDGAVAATARRAAIRSRRSALAAREKALAGLEEGLAGVAAIVSRAEETMREASARIAEKERELLDEKRRREEEEKRRREAEARERELALARQREEEARLARERWEAERRTSKRLHLELEVTFTSEHNFYTGFSGDISEGGLFIATANPLAIGQEIDVTFTLPNNHKVSTRGEVRWVRDTTSGTFDSVGGMGVRFTQLFSEDETAVRAFVSNREPIFYDE